MEYVAHILIIVAIYSILALGQSIVMGTTRLLTIAGAAFYGIGAYVAAIGAVKLGINPFFAFLFAPLVAGSIALFVGATFARFRDDYFMLATLGFLMIFITLARNLEPITGGVYGIPAIPKFMIGNFAFNTPLSFLLLSLTVVLLVSGLIFYISKSSFYRVLQCIREDEDALKVFGYNTSVYKLSIFVFGAMVSSLAGVLFAHYITFVDPTSFSINESILLWAIVVLGGLGKNRGVFLGALILIILPELLRFVGFQENIAALLRQFLYGGLLVFLMLNNPKGILGNFKL